MFTYEQLSTFAGSWGLVFLFAMFLISLAYALWPGNRDRFEAAAQMPLHDEDAVTVPAQEARQ